MAIEIRELLIRTFVGSQDIQQDKKSTGDKKSTRKKKETTQNILSDVSKMLQQSQER